MSRTPLFGSLRGVIGLAALAARASSRDALDEVLARVEAVRTRRRFLRDAAALGAATVVAGCAAPAGPPPAPSPRASSGGPRVVIVGGGIAGLVAAHELGKSGVDADLFEGSDRTGGRMYTARDLLGAGLTTELGGEFIDSTHEAMLALMDELGLERLDTLAPGSTTLASETYFLDGRHRSRLEVARAFVPVAARILEDYDSMGEVVSFETEGGGGALDRTSIAEYFDRIGLRGWMRELLETAYVTEYGLDPGEQSALNFLFLIGTGDLENAEDLALLGASDERYKVRGGNQRIVDELARRHEPRIRRGHRLEAIRSRGDGFTLSFRSEGRVVDEQADLVLLTIPFSVLRELEVDVELPPLKRRAIAELGYGANAKVLVGFRSRPWEGRGYAGNVYSDESFQLAWANSYLQEGSEGGLTLYSGGKLAHEVGAGTAEAVAERLLPGIERAFPGTSAERNGKVARFHWPTYPWAKGSYSCYRPGQWTTIAGSEGLPVGNLFFAGEHCSYDFQGFMNGAAVTGAEAARAMLARRSGVVLQQRPTRRALLGAAASRRRPFRAGSVA